ncbi:MAG: SDR family NAD(P)-dependent oxidoreductase [Rhodanobacteraceae bacterium]
MRTSRNDVLPASERVRVLALDVTDPESVRAAVTAAGPIDALANNAGFGAASPIELTPLATARRWFEINTLGILTVTQVPQLRQRGAGVIVNISSSVTYKPMPLIGARWRGRSRVRPCRRVKEN